MLPAGWKQRLVPVRNENTAGATGLCLEAHDLAVSKLVAGRDKDVHFVAGMIRHAMTSKQTIRERLAQTTLDDAVRKLCIARLERITG